MSSIAISGDTSGAVTIAAPAVAGTNTMTLVAGTGTLAPKVLSTAVTATSGTSIDFTNIPSWVTRITVMFSGVSTTGTGTVIIQLGTGSTPTYQTSGYLGNTQNGTGNLNWSSGMPTGTDGGATYVRHGVVTISTLSSNTWAAGISIGQSDSGRVGSGGGSVLLSATLTAVRITTVGGTDTFDAGTINIMYE